MDMFLTEKIFKSNDDNFLREVFKKTRVLADEKFGKKINFYYTSNFFPPISVTGKKCFLNCLHCQHKLLDMMISVKTPEEFVKKCIQLEKNGAKGILVSGGCLQDFTVPLENFTGAIKEVKKQTSLFVLAHTGLLTIEKAKLIKECGVDGVALDVVGSPETTRRIYGVEISKDKYIESLVSAEKAGFSIVSPHVCVGLHFGFLKGELEALKIISKIKPTTIVITALMPLFGTPLEDCLVNPVDVAKIVAIAKLMFPDVPITLGCARSKGKIRERIEVLAFQAGVTSIAMPTKKIHEFVRKEGYRIEFFGACCGFPPLPRLKVEEKLLS